MRARIYKIEDGKQSENYFETSDYEGFIALKNSELKDQKQGFYMIERILESVFDFAYKRVFEKTFSIFTRDYLIKEVALDHAIERS
jgi:hypothetical protein